MTNLKLMFWFIGFGIAVGIIIYLFILGSDRLEK